MQNKIDNENIENLSFEEAMEKLELIVRQLEEGKIPLEEAITAFEKGSKLKEICEEKLKQAQLKIEKLVPLNDGTMKTETFDA